MKVQIVQATIAPDDRERYLRAWAEWMGTLFTMGIRAALYESAESPGTFTEITWFEPGQEPALADDRVVRLDAAPEAAARRREGARDLQAPVAV